MAGKFEVYEPSTGTWKWRLRGEDGGVVLTSGAYTNKDDAKEAAHTIADAAKGAKMEVQ